MSATAPTSPLGPGLPELRDILSLPPEIVRRFDEEKSQLVARVDAALFRRPDLGVLLGDASSTSVRELNRYLAAFLGSVFTLGVPEILVEGLPRLLSGYRNRGLPQDYLEVMPELWEGALVDQMGPGASPLVQVLEWLRGHPESWSPPEDSVDDRAEDSRVDALVTALLEGDAPAAHHLVRTATSQGMELPELLVGVVQPALYEIGRRWETGRISAAQEHLASALVARLLSRLETLTSPGDSRLAVVATAPTETHEFGAWMVADVLRNAGWDVRFLGRQLPVEECLHYVRSADPSLLAVSVTLEIHLPSLGALVEAIRNDPKLRDLPILVGGQAFAGGEAVWQRTGADAVALDAREVPAVAEGLLSAPHAARA